MLIILFYFTLKQVILPIQTNKPAENIHLSRPTEIFYETRKKKKKGRKEKDGRLKYHKFNKIQRN